MTNVALYAEGKNLFVRVISSVDDESLARSCRACPGWSVRDVLAHHVGVLQAKLKGAIPPAALDAVLDPDPTVRRKASEERDQWTAEGVAASRASGVEELLSQWDELAPAVTEEDAALLCVDVIVHLFDVEETLDDFDDRTSPVVVGALRILHWALTTRLGREGLDPITLVCADTGDVLKAMGGGGTVRGKAYDLMRCITGRRERVETNELLEWTGVPEAAHQAFNLYGWADAPADKADRNS